MPGAAELPGSTGSQNGGGTVANTGTQPGAGSQGRPRNGSTQGGTPGGATARGAGDDPFAGLGTPGSGGMTAAERRAALDARLEVSFGVFDGMILSDRERAQAEADAAGSQVMSTGGGQGAGQENGGLESGEGSVAVASAPNSAVGGVMPAGGIGREGDFSNVNAPTFPVPGDIPSGDDDDVVARQLREAAIHEPDPVLREKLWDEYRKYSGLAQ